MIRESVYLMPGMGANPRIFEFLSLEINISMFTTSHGFLLKKTSLCITMPNAWGNGLSIKIRF